MFVFFSEYRGRHAETLLSVKAFDVQFSLFISVQYIKWDFHPRTKLKYNPSSSLYSCLYPTAIHPPKSVTDGQRSLSSPENKNPPNLELNLKRSEMECAGYTCSVVVRCVFVLSCKCPQFIRYSIVGCSLCRHSCASSVHWSVSVHYSFGNIRLIDPFYVRALFVTTGPCSLQVLLCAVRLPNLTD